MAGARGGDLLFLKTLRDVLLVPALQAQNLVRADLSNEELRNFVPAARDEIVKALQKGPIAVTDPATGNLKIAKEIFHGGVSNTTSLQCVAVALYNAVNEFLCGGVSSNKRFRKITWGDLSPGASRAQDLRQEGLWEALDFFLSLIAANQSLYTTVKAYLDTYFVNPGTAACNTATRARLEACFAHMLAAFPEPAANLVPNMVPNDDDMASPDLLSPDPTLLDIDLPDIEETDFEDLLRAFGVEAAPSEA
ncbi:hypothetical protein KFL_009630020 [Klebsormidium nitens]|uniref:Uncharacterized protein n=1 Tax=Klebsormidium nitens TaxID=105231 RepID=A0A1Y1ING2_KLENI|nr:hypothetical protein KFL_009630020 [Klebsormidium nitens]|eukprot:GAQ92274.1 hypothetical protein KFL_009630020 [Klebsormidium nitens]